MYSDSTGKRLEVICLAMKDSQICMMIFFGNHLQNIVDMCGNALFRMYVSPYENGEQQ